MDEKNKGPETTLRLKKILNAPREKVFRAWTEAEALKTWFAPSDDHSALSAEVDLRVGGKYAITLRSPKGEVSRAVGTYREIRPPEKLVFTWSWEGEDLGETLVTIEFLDRGGSTELVLTHEFLLTKEWYDKHAYGWNGCLDSLAKETGVLIVRREQRKHLAVPGPR